MPTGLPKQPDEVDPTKLLPVRKQFSKVKQFVQSLSMIEFASLLDINIDKIYDWRATLILNPDNTVNLPRTIVTMRQRRVHYLPPSNTEDETKKWLMEWRKTKAERERLFLKRDLGELVSREQVNRDWSKHINDTRLLIETLPEMLALLIPDDNLRPIIKAEAQRIVSDALRTLSGSDLATDSPSPDAASPDVLPYESSESLRDRKRPHGRPRKL